MIPLLKNNEMKQLNLYVKQIYKKFRNLILYGLIGTVSASADFVVYYILSNLIGLFYLYANSISVTFGISISFILNRKYNFKVKDKVYKRLIIFFLVGFSGLLLSSGLLYVFIDMFYLDKLVSKLLSIILVVTFQFIVNKYVTFNSKRI